MKHEYVKLSHFVINNNFHLDSPNIVNKLKKYPKYLEIYKDIKMSFGTQSNIRIINNDFEKNDCLICGNHIIQYKKEKICKHCTRKINENNIKENTISKQEIIKILKNTKINQNIGQLLKTKNIHRNIITHTDFLPKKTKITERIFCLINKIKSISEIPKCEICGSKVNFGTYTEGYKSTCSKKCNGKLDSGAGPNISITKRTKRYPILKKLFEGHHITIISDSEIFITKNKIKGKCDFCGEIFTKVYHKINYPVNCPRCCTCGKSKYELEIKEFLELNHINLIMNSRPIKDHSQKGNAGNREIDILIPNQLGIEFNGNYWHSELSGGKTRNYHLEKTNMVREQLGIQLIHILESEWTLKRKIVESILLNKLGQTANKIYARKCVIKEVDSKSKNEFLENNHIQGKDRSSIRLGLYFENRLVSIMTFGSRKITNKTSFEMIRFCSILNSSVVGGASKLFKYFVKNYWNGNEITTYADKRFSDGTFYKKLGFELSHESAPNYWYVHNSDMNILYHRANFMKHKLKDKLEIFDPSLTEWENMIEHEYDRIWDCGNFVFKYS